MAKLKKQAKSGKIANARELKGLKSQLKELGIEDLIDNYKGFYYTVWRKYNNQKRIYDFKTTGELIKESEKILIEDGWELIKSAKTNKIEEKYHILGGVKNENV